MPCAPLQVSPGAEGWSELKVNAFEVAARYVYPAVRRRVVEILREMGLSQREIARLLHVTQSAVSRYLSMERGKDLDLSRYSDIDSYLRRIAREIVSSSPDEYCIHALLVKATLVVLAKGYACSIHAEVDPSIDPRKCRVCTEILARALAPELETIECIENRGG